MLENEETLLESVYSRNGQIEVSHIKRNGSETDFGDISYQRPLRQRCFGIEVSD